MAIGEVDTDFRDFLKICGVESCPDWIKAHEKLTDIKNKAVRRAITVMVNDLYDYDTQSIKRDAARITLADFGEDVRPEPEERQKLLRVLWWIFGVYFEGNYWELVEECVSQAQFSSHLGR
ncbi:MAG: hypothetical protein NC123_15385 [Butyrivibrio sp.]|nr:hypothetical protein [Acetatifactor muris]MCM1560903.1 hypothetical protein [Butyrivibrio sp.]